MARGKIEVVDRRIEADSVPRGQVLIQAVWRAEDGQLYYRQAIGDARTIVAMPDLRTQLLWSFNAAFLSAMAATFDMAVAEIEPDPMAPKSAIVRPDGTAYDAPDGGTHEGAAGRIVKPN